MERECSGCMESDENWWTTRILGLIGSGDDAWSELDDYLKAWREINFKFARSGSIFQHA